MTRKTTDPLFRFVPADDDMTDDEYEVVGGTARVSIQVAGYAGGYFVNEYSPEGDKDFWMRDHGVFRSLKSAKAKALQIAGLAVAA